MTSAWSPAGNLSGLYTRWQLAGLPFSGSTILFSSVFQQSICSLKKTQAFKIVCSLATLHALKMLDSGMSDGVATSQIIMQTQLIHLPKPLSLRWGDSDEIGNSSEIKESPSQSSQENDAEQAQLKPEPASQLTEEESLAGILNSLNGSTPTAL
ncbi:hypothetical protein C8J56DRAFT_894313 [Mycena floridula]|nr:hypothetical protein C8J56DRAFT_894313 [Mycena floridula]